MRPINLINGDVKIGRLGAEFVAPENLVPEEYLDLVSKSLNILPK